MKLQDNVYYNFLLGHRASSPHSSPSSSMCETNTETLLDLKQHEFPKAEYPFPPPRTNFFSNFSVETGCYHPPFFPIFLSLCPPFPFPQSCGAWARMQFSNPQFPCCRLFCRSFWSTATIYHAFFFRPGDGPVRSVPLTFPSCPSY